MECPAVTHFDLKVIYFQAYIDIFCELFFGVFLLILFYVLVDLKHANASNNLKIYSIFD